MNVTEKKKDQITSVLIQPTVSLLHRSSIYEAD